MPLQVCLILYITGSCKRLGDSKKKTLPFIKSRCHQKVSEAGKKSTRSSAVLAIRIPDVSNVRKKTGFCMASYNDK